MVNATVTVSSFTPDGSIDFHVDVDDCSDSSGKFAYSYRFSDDQGIEHDVEQNYYWNYTHGQTSFDITDDLTLALNNTLLGVTVFASSVDVTCHDVAPKNNLFSASIPGFEIISASEGYVVNPDDGGPLLDLDAVLLDRITPKIQQKVRDVPPGGRVVGDEIYNVGLDYTLASTKIEYDPTILRGIDESVERTSLHMLNDSKQQRQMGQKLSLTTKVGSTVELNRVLVTKQKVTVGVKIYFVNSGGEKEVTLTESDKRTQSFQEDLVVTENREQTVSAMVDFTATMEVRKRRDTQKFTATVLVGGNVHWRMHAAVADGGLTLGLPISELMTEVERTFNVNGTISNITVVDQNVLIKEVPLAQTP